MNTAKRIFALFLMVICLVSAIPVSAHNAYFLSITIDPGTFEYIGTVTYEDTGLLQTETHTEVKLNAIFTMHQGWSGQSDTYKNLIMANEDKTQEIREFYIGTEDTKGKTGMYAWDSKKVPTDACMAFTFPSWHPGVWNSIWGMSAQTDVKDEKRAQRVVDYAVRDLNKCLNWVRSTCYKGRIPNMNEMKNLATRIAACAKSQSGSISVQGCTVSFSAATNATPGEGLTKSDYVKVTITKADGSSQPQEFCRRVPKGYYQITGDTLWAENKASKYLDVLHSGDAKDVQYIDWDLIVMQGNYNADVSKVTFATLDEIVNPGWFTSLIGSFMKWVITSIASGLGLKPYEDFFLIRNQVASEYVYGMFPTGWLAPMMLLYAASLTLAMSLIGFSVLKILWKQQLSTVNIGEKIAMQESLKNLIVTLFLFFAFIPIFIFLAGLNVTLVELFGSTITSNTLTGIVTVSYISFGSIILGVAELILQIYFNFFYIVRGITIAVLVGISPLAIYTISLGGKLAGVFTAFMKELLSHIFTQSVHAIMAAFFFNALSLSIMTPFEKIVVLISFIPITKFVKTKIFQLTEGPSSQVAATGTKGATSAASGALKGTGGGPGGGRGGSGGGSGGPGGGGGSGGSGGGSSSSVLGSAIDRTASQQRSSNAAASRGTPIKMADTPSSSSGSGVGRPGGAGGPKALPAPANSSAGTAIGRPNTGVGPAGAPVSTSTQNHTFGANGAGGAGGNGWRDVGSRDMDRQAASQFGHAALGAAGSMLKGSLYGGMALGMAAIGEDPSRYAEEAGRANVQGMRMMHDANREAMLYMAPGGIRDQEIQRMQQAGIGGMATNGSSMQYNIDSSRANAQHRAVYDDLRQAYTPSEDGNFSHQQTQAQAFYRDNYGVTSAKMDPVNGNRMTVNMDMSKMEAHHISETDPFTQMKTFKWKEEK